MFEIALVVIIIPVMSFLEYFSEPPLALIAFSTPYS